jgi:sortase A
MKPDRQQAEQAAPTEEHDLLQALISNQPPKDSLAPVALRSRHQQRDHALQAFQRRTWVDRMLPRVERVLIVGLLVVLGVWLWNGPIYDWLHAPPPLAQAVAQPTAVPVKAEPLVNAPLPFTVPDMEVPLPADDYLVPRQAAESIGANEAVAQPVRLLVPTIGLDTPIKEVFVVDGAWEVADYAAGYLNGTALPGEGNTALAGHAGLRGAVFRDLGKLVEGDPVSLEAGGWIYEYRVRTAYNVWPTQVEVLEAGTNPILTLITCTNWDTQRLIVVADLVASKPLPPR